jgi:hypothetical protein
VPLHVFHREENVLGSLLNGVKRDDIRMIQSGHDLGFALERLATRRIVRHSRWKCFDGYEAVIAAFLSFSAVGLANRPSRRPG